MPETEGTRVRLKLGELEIALVGECVGEISSCMSRKFRVQLLKKSGSIGMSLWYVLPSIRTLSKCTSTLSVFQNYT